MSRRSKRPAKNRRTKTETIKRAPGNLAFRAGTFTISMIGLASAIIAFWPRPLAAVSDPVDVDKPFSSSITISNASFLPLEDVVPEVALKSVKRNFPSPMEMESQTPYGARFEIQDFRPRELWMDDRFTFALNDVLTISSKDHLDSADIAVVVT